MAGRSWVGLMPYDYLLDRAQRRLTVISSDPITLAEVLALLERQAAEGAWAYPTIDDVRGVTEYPSARELRRVLAQVATLSQTHGPRGPVAFVAAIPVFASVARMYGTLSEGSQLSVRAFYDLAKAARWLDAQTSVPTDS